MIILDTSVLSLSFRRRKQGQRPHKCVAELRRLIDADAAVAVPGVVLQELLSGVKDEKQFARLEAALAGFPLLLAERQTHLLAAHVIAECRKKGVAAASFDALIAATSIEHEGTLFSVDEDFRRIAKHTRL